MKSTPNIGSMSASSRVPAADTTGSIAAPIVTPSRSSEGAGEAPGEAEAILSRAARTTWALLLTRIYEVFPLVCPRCGGEMRIIAFITDAGAVREILTHRANRPRRHV